MRGLLLGLSVIAVMLILGAGCQEEQPEQTQPPQTTVTGELKEFTVTAKQWEFIPDPIEVNKGDKVKLKIASIDVTHGFALPDFGISERLEPGRTVTVEFIADKTGTFEFFCNVPCGAGHSAMRGQLIVR